MKLPGIVFIVVGLVMAFFTSFVNSRVEGSSITIFFYVAFGFVIYGFFKLVTAFILRDKTPRPTTIIPPHKIPIERTIVKCPICMTKHYSNSNFCHLCGAKLNK